MGNVETHLDRVFAEAADEFKSSYANKIIHYKLYDPDMCKLIKEGNGSLVSCSYSTSLDCNIYTVVDADTGEKISAHQFRLRIE